MENTHNEVHVPILLGDFIVETYNNYLAAAKSVCDISLVQKLLPIEKLGLATTGKSSGDTGRENLAPLGKMGEVALATKQLKTILEGGIEMRANTSQRDLAGVVTLLGNLGEQIGQVQLPDDSEANRQSVAYLSAEYNRYVKTVLDATDDSIIKTMFRPLEAQDESASVQAKLTEVRLAQSGLLSYLKEVLGPLAPAPKLLMRDITDEDHMWLQIDVPDPVGEDVVAFYRATAHTLDEDDESPNAEEWAELKDWQLEQENFQSIEGWWEGRWDGESAEGRWSVGGTRIREIDGWFHIIWKSGGVEVFKARRVEGNLLMGRHINLYDPGDSGAWVGRIISNRRIDGKYEGGGAFPTGRFDFRR